MITDEYIFLLFDFYLSHLSYAPLSAFFDSVNGNTTDCLPNIQSNFYSNSFTWAHGYPAKDYISQPPLQVGEVI